MSKIRLATVWLDGCSGCHMSFLDMDERLIDLAEKVELVYSPLVDAKKFPDDVDVTLVEGAVSSEEDLHKILTIRARIRRSGLAGRLRGHRQCAVDAQSFRGATRCAIAPTARTLLWTPGCPTRCPELSPSCVPVHEVVPVDVFVPGCPPSADVISISLSELLEGRSPELSAKTRFGA